MERYGQTDQARVLAAVAGHEFNNELTVILSSISTVIQSLEPGHPALAQALELQSAAQRCAHKTAELLRFGSKRNSRVSRMSLERLTEEEWAR